jgi:hypothetical protein
VVGIEEFVPDVEDEGNFWDDEQPKEQDDDKEKSEEVRDRDWQTLVFVCLFVCFLHHLSFLAHA